MTEQKDLKINSGRVLTDNELIAQFMGLPLVKTLPSFTGGTHEVSFQKWRYDTSWDWLLDVVSKIHIMWEHGELFKCPYYHRIDNMKLYSSIGDVHKSVVDFIKWYNETQSGRG
jgi:hypothetical protein